MFLDILKDGFGGSYLGSRDFAVLTHLVELIIFHIRSLFGLAQYTHFGNRTSRKITDEVFLTRDLLFQSSLSRPLSILDDHESPSYCFRNCRKRKRCGHWIYLIEKSHLLSLFVIYKGKIIISNQFQFGSNVIVDV